MARNRQHKFNARKTVVEEEESKKEKESKNSYYILSEVPESLFRKLKTEAKIEGKRVEEFCGFLLQEGLRELRWERGPISNNGSKTLLWGKNDEK